MKLRNIAIGWHPKWQWLHSHLFSIACQWVHLSGNSVVSQSGWVNLHFSAILAQMRCYFSPRMENEKKTKQKNRFTDFYFKQKCKETAIPKKKNNAITIRQKTEEYKQCSSLISSSSSGSGSRFSRVEEKRTEPVILLFICIYILCRYYYYSYFCFLNTQKDLLQHRYNLFSDIFFSSPYFLVGARRCYFFFTYIV